jgi:Domain of unknown function (DUF4214)
MLRTVRLRAMALGALGNIRLDDCSGSILCADGRHPRAARPRSEMTTHTIPMTKALRYLALPLLAAFATAQASPHIGGCPIFPADNVWNTPVNTLPVHANSANYLANMSPASGFHMDFGSGLCCQSPPDPDRYIGIPYVVVPQSQPKVPVTFDVPEESDPGPYPIPPNAPIEGDPVPDGTDSHVLVIVQGTCDLYETDASTRLNNGASWTAFSGAKWSLRSHALRTADFTSGDAAGLPILPGLVKYDEAAAGLIEHALRFTTQGSHTQMAYIWPARHEAGSTTNVNAPPFGLRLRLKAAKNISTFTPVAKAIAQAMKTYGIILADNGSNWYVSGTTDSRWDNDVLHELDVLKGSDFEVVDTSSMILGIDSMAVVTPACSRATDADGDGMTDCIDITEGRNAAAKDNDVFTDARLFAMQQYRDFFSREGDLAGVQGWTDAVVTGAFARTQVIDAFLSSPEFAGFVAPVVRLYFATFLRVPDYAGLIFNAGLVRSGTITVTQLADFFTQSPEFMSLYGSLDNTQFVTLLYSNVLHRAPDTAGLNGWVQLLTTGGYSRGQVLLGFSDSTEYQANTVNEVFVAMMYTGMLRRTPESTGYNAWVNGLKNSTYSRTQVINGFFLSTEYRARFLP